MNWKVHSINFADLDEMTGRVLVAVNLLGAGVLYHSDQPGGGFVDDKKIRSSESGGRPDDDDGCRWAAAPIAMTPPPHH